MFVESMFGLSLLLNPPTITVALEPRTALAMAPATIPSVSTHQKETALLPLVQRATECIARKVSADPRFAGDLHPTAISDLIIDSIPACARPVQAMIDVHDRLYGSGSGEAFLLGPYLDVLPAAIVKQTRIKP